MSTMNSKATHALKEWDVAVNALEQGKMIMLLRKGGIREEGNRFKVAFNNVWLYPTYEHQKPHLLKAEYANTVEPVPSGWHPHRIRIGSWAEITDILPITNPATVDSLLPFHIWNQQFSRDRLQWKPRQPLYVLLLRTYLLPVAVTIPYRTEYSGCRSWIELAQPISTEGLVPVLNDTQYTQQSDRIRQIIAPKT